MALPAGPRGAATPRVAEFLGLPCDGIFGAAMSYDIELVDPVTRQTLKLDAPHQMRGGTYALGGTTEASLNVTYNYAGIFRRVFSGEPANAPDMMAEMFDKSGAGIRSIYGKTGAESLPILDRAIAMLGNDVDDDYWKPTEGNAKRALVQLRALAAMRPDGVWTGD